ncbi:hypothetical protein FHW79_006012 [Azospirillum sp. OGB3]|uniref:hypothetical protein n=1 Tax=Azospirillum sp. OGB3 TaxID=2587012 RepID=UPI001606BEA2|nr:hypothetical protein [Azospirillum sp. OGB3]MBB3268337.1 hypothetical protein [Azospirillum sp. OGB3]
MDVVGADVMLVETAPSAAVDALIGAVLDGAGFPAGPPELAASNAKSSHQLVQALKPADKIERWQSCRD